ncbi:MAG: aspartate--tRNA ligase [Clostridia bacterium]|nr:aspartate--tRNA ligase [Clostridia bacterium]
MAELMKGMKRTGRLTDFSQDNIGEQVTVMGWVRKRRDLGGVIFIDLKDISGILQIVFKKELNEELFEKAETLRNEYVIAVKGLIIKRDEETINPNLTTGYIEVVASELRILSEAKTPPIDMEENSKTNELMRLKYRYLDLRRQTMQDILLLRHRIYKITRNFFDENGFYEIETPMLTKSTPEGARDYLVPSRVNQGTFYALPQSPQIFKQLLMLSGFDRYMQVVRCFRDEDLRANRQPEFTQIDLEMSFVDVDDVIEVNERYLKKLFKDTKNIDIALPIKRMTYKEAMERFGSDKPDTRFGIEIVDLSSAVKDCGFQVFTGAIKNGGSVRAINAKGCGKIFSRRDIDSLGDYTKLFGSKGMAWIQVEQDNLKSAITKFLSEEEIKTILDLMDAAPGDLICFIADADEKVFNILGTLRLEIARRTNLLDGNEEMNLLWVTEFPLLEYDEEQKRFSAKHHPFTSPMDEDLSLIDTDPGKVRAKAYDIVLNGEELGGGSIRIYDQEVQRKMFSLLGFTDEDAQERFGFLIDALKYGTPPHGGLAYGLDRLVMSLAGTDNIRDVIAFPKIQNASCPLSSAPSIVDKKQLDDLGIELKKD